MKKKVIYTLLTLMLIAGLATACSVTPVEATDYRWTIIESPITGHYYEVATYGTGRYATSAMSEVTQAEYEAYVAGLE